MTRESGAGHVTCHVTDAREAAALAVTTREVTCLLSRKEKTNVSELTEVLILTRIKKFKEFYDY